MVTCQDVAPASGPAPAQPARERLVALDVFRGLTMAAMILVNNPGSNEHTYGPLRHAPWHGWTPTDLIFPSFLFIVGVSMVLSLAGRQERGDGRRALLLHVGKRAVLLYLISIFVLGPFIPNLCSGRLPSFQTIRILGVLPRIALCCLAVAPIVLYTRRRSWAIITAALLLLYYALMMLVPVPGHGAGLLDSQEWNLEAYIDRLVLGRHLWRGSRLWDPEGILSTLPAIGTTLLGALTGAYLRSSQRPPEKIRSLLLGGGALLLAGLAWDQVFPINKNLWTSSYVLFAGGFASALLAVCYWLVDIKGCHRLIRPFVIFGMNPLAAYLLSSFAANLLYAFDVRLPDGKMSSPWGLIYRVLFVPWAGELNGSLAFAISYVLIWLGVMTIFYRRRIFLRL